MKLRNKKTGEIVDTTEPLADLNKEWEVCEPKEPLIKDEKIRKAIRAWADANGYSIVRVGFYGVADANIGNIQIHFKESDIIDEDKYGVHNIAELCGEEEE